eukprot:CAMPEP_0182941892 /NCGR_PEP_ID=MMETSP0105_2-20130417/49683_1 /TAXON_ID=81532 ORGANISM="Acanthoeca-like sp., Strain 10tr" /NCGR_SAMPLE_ID=MMETSP0105_2 /ASSEMBLY_ACC=CAM_ASM_000205 /LENGTH=111 /DNA_ID=CAMNT_0025081563 /DNA_START=254 /DNA_END=589 /DNA_ORIENTATION=-
MGCFPKCRQHSTGSAKCRPQRGHSNGNSMVGKAGAGKGKAKDGDCGGAAGTRGPGSTHSIPAFNPSRTSTGAAAPPSLEACGLADVYSPCSDWEAEGVVLDAPRDTLLSLG